MIWSCPRPRCSGYGWDGLSRFGFGLAALCHEAMAAKACVNVYDLSLDALTAGAEVKARLGQELRHGARLPVVAIHLALPLPLPLAFGHGFPSRCAENLPVRTLL